MSEEEKIDLIKEGMFEENEFRSENFETSESEFAKSINYGGYSSEEEFWEVLFD